MLSLSPVKARMRILSAVFCLKEPDLFSDRQYRFAFGRFTGDLLANLTHRQASAIESQVFYSQH